MSLQTITTGNALRQMHELTKKGIPFSFSFYTYTAKTKQSRGKVHVPKAFLRKQAKAIDGVPSVLLEYMDVSQQRLKHCYICLLTEFNGIKIVLK